MSAQLNLAGTTNSAYPSNGGQNPGAISTGGVDNPFREFFGEPIRELQLNPYNAFRRENLALPDAYKGPSPFMTQVIIKLVTDTDMWPVTVALPFRLTEDSNEIAWDEIRFNNHLLGPVPEEGVSRLISQEVNQRTESYVRYGIAFLVEHGFMKTERGRLSYRMNLEQIRNAIIDTAYIGVLEAYLRSKQYAVAFTRRYGNISGMRLRNILAEELDGYAAVQKNEHGFEILDSRMKRLMAQSGITPNLWILPQGVKMYLALARPENVTYALKGPDGQLFYKEMMNTESGVYYNQQIGCNVVETKAFELPGNNADPFDPLFRSVSVGEYNIMIDTVSRFLPEGTRYHSSMRDIFVYNEEKDNFSRITIKAALDHCNRFDKEGHLWWPTLHFPFDPSISDIFVSNADQDAAIAAPARGFGAPGGGAQPEVVSQQPCRFFGDMSEEYLRLETLKDFVASVVKANAQDSIGLAKTNTAPVPARHKYLYTEEKINGTLAQHGITAEHPVKTTAEMVALIVNKHYDVDNLPNETSDRIIRLIQNLNDDNTLGKAMVDFITNLLDKSGTEDIEKELAKFQADENAPIVAPQELLTEVQAAAPPATGFGAAASLYDLPYFGRQSDEVGVPAKRGAFGASRDSGYMAPKTTDDGKATPSANLSKRWANIESMFTGAELAIAQRFLVTEIKKDVLEKIIAAHVMFPFSFLLMRPYITHRMGTGILTKSGPETGETLVGHMDFQLGDDVARKVHYGNLTAYLKSIVYKNDNVGLAENIYSAGYVRGNNVMMHNLVSSGERNARSSGNESMYVCLIPYLADGEQFDASYASELPNPMDSTGSFSKNQPHLSALDNDIGNVKHYATSDFYSRVYQFSNDAPDTATAGYVYAELNRYNTVLYQGHQAGFNRSTGNFDLVTEGTGHWGNRCYPGCGKVRKGLVKVLEPITYTTEFGVRTANERVGF